MDQNLTVLGRQQKRGFETWDNWNATNGFGDKGLDFDQQRTNNKSSI